MKETEVPVKLRGVHRYLRKVTELKFTETPDYVALEYLIRNIKRPVIEEEEQKLAIEATNLLVSRVP